MSRASLPVVSDHSSTRPDEIQITELHNALRNNLAGEVRFDRLSRALYSTDASVYQIVPLAVVIPKTEADLVATVRTCARFGIPLTARGGGTSQAGQAIGPGIIVDCSKYLDRIVEINAAERWVRVQPGCVLDDLNLAVRGFGLQFAPDISTSNRATIGGMIANNSSGTHSLIHGKTIDHVLELKLILADGSIIDARPLDAAAVAIKCRQADREGACYRTVQTLVTAHADEIARRFPKILRRVGGYNLDLFTDPQQPFNLAHLFVGSEGTLGITLEAKLRLIELPKAKAVLVVQFADLLDALAATPAVLSHAPSAVEVLDDYVLASTRRNPEAARLRDFLQGDPGAVLFIEFYGDSAAELPPRLEALQADLLRRGFGSHFYRAAEPGPQARIWKLRKLALGLSMAEKGDAKAISFVEDTAVAPQKLRDYIAEFLAIVARHGTKAGVYAHASVGCLHVRPVINLKTAEGVHQFEAIAAEVADLVLQYGGALSGEHGDGLVRSPFQEKMYGPVLYAAFRELKRTLDPDSILNPGKIVDAPPLASQFRYGPGYLTPEVSTVFDFTADGGLTRSAELCAGVGECRKKRDGTMCPSYQATREEEHSTRGRANALRLAITGQLGAGGFTDPSLREVLDLCLECKACKSECPTNVDMARLKAEFLHHYFQEHGLPWRNWLFGHVATFGRAGSALAPTINRLGQNRLLRWLGEVALGIDRRRALPQFARLSLSGRLRRLAQRASAQPEQANVLLFCDTFTDLFEPDLGRAAAALLGQAGCGVDFGLRSSGEESIVCCGRPLISNGLLDQAVRHAQHNVQRLHEAAVAGKMITACEPSCLLTIQDDYPALLRGELRQKAAIVAAACRTFEQVLEAREGSKDLRFASGPKKILVQGHCHQRSLTGMEPTLRLLRRIPGAEVVDLDAGCCGMAGSFGYEREHYEISRAVGEQRLFPALRAASADTVVVAAGFSCRRQIEHFTGRAALHPAELLWSLAGKLAT
ncbi:MAG TPA: FAD-linked oxidase C-terminal domain-containing protein [Gemmataceae bacterium]|nr:FAD-linked oxidase C-terminal domain-containing protein [Gemmataceae bacterium]